MGLRGRNTLTGYTAFFVTTTVINHIRVFSNERAADILVDIIKFYQKKFLFHILGYVIMPSHFHWIIKTDPKLGSISAIMRDIKKSSAWQILDYIKLTDPELSIEIENAHSGLPLDQKRKLWEPRFDDTAIRNEKMFFDKLSYIHNNPVKAGLSKIINDYKYSSASDYYKIRSSPLNVDIEFAGIEIR